LNFSSVTRWQIDSQGCKIKLDREARLKSPLRFEHWSIS